MEAVVLFCQHSVLDESEVIRSAEQVEEFSLKVKMLPCSSKIHSHELLQLIAAGADCVEVIGCPVKGCRFLIGSSRAEKRVARAGMLLDTLKAGGCRIGITRRTGVSGADLVEIATARVNAVKEYEKGEGQ